MSTAAAPEAAATGAPRHAIHCHVLVEADDPAIATALNGAALDVCVAAAEDALAAALVRLAVAPDRAVSLVVADDAALHALNRAYRAIDAPTDVLSFRAGAEADWPDDTDADDRAAAELGDIVLSLPYAARSAAARGAPLVDELRLLAVHGLLHLLGHDDADDDGAAAMRAEEVRLGVRAADELA